MSEQGSSPARVLVVDDSEAFRNVLSSVTAATPGFEVVGEASTGREALDLVAALDVQLVLMDVQMPEMDGIEAALRIRERHPDVAVILLTATREATLDNQSLTIEDKRDLSPRWLTQMWRWHGVPTEAEALRRHRPPLLHENGIVGIVDPEAEIDRARTTRRRG